MGDNAKSMVRRIALLALLIARPAFAHPLHTSLAQVSVSGATVSVSLRVFADDYTAASHARLVDYAVANFIVKDMRGNTIKLTSCGGKRMGDLMWLCFRGTGNIATVESKVLFDKFKDQINIVQASFSGRTRNLLFTPGDRAKPIA
jgi:hypothetical protein